MLLKAVDIGVHGLENTEGIESEEPHEITYLLL